MKWLAIVFCIDMQGCPFPEGAKSIVFQSREDCLAAMVVIEREDKNIVTDPCTLMCGTKCLENEPGVEHFPRIILRKGEKEV